MSTSEIQPVGIGDIIREVNESDEILEDQYLRAREAADLAGRSQVAAGRAMSAARQARVAHQAIQAENPRRRGSRPAHLLIALMTVALDGVACYFAAQALNGDQDATLVWTGIFLVCLAGGEFALDYYQDRHRRLWYLLVAFVTAFVGLLGLLRYSYLAAIDVGNPLTAVTGAGLFTAATIGFVFWGYRALRTAETQPTWRARRAARRARAMARAAEEDSARDAKSRDQLADAYLWQVRRIVLRTCPDHFIPALEAAVRAHLTGRTEG